MVAISKHYSCSIRSLLMWDKVWTLAGGSSRLQSGPIGHLGRTTRPHNHKPHLRRPPPAKKESTHTPVASKGSTFKNIDLPNGATLTQHSPGALFAPTLGGLFGGSECVPAPASGDCILSSNFFAVNQKRITDKTRQILHPLN